MFDVISAIMGIIIGFIIMILLVWIAYLSGSFVFSYCASNVPICSSNDYINNPGQAITNGFTVDEILFLNDENIMFYTRPPATSSCVPTTGQTVQILYPQYCEFFVPGTGNVQGKAVSYNNPAYELPDGQLVDTHDHDNCTPDPGALATTGVPLLKWDPAPL